jgi:hypothetical protein
MTGGEFIRQIVIYQRTDPMFLPLANFALWLVLGYWPVLPMLMVGSYFILRNLRNVLVLFVGVAVLINLTIISRVGSAQNYQFEIIFASAILGGLGLSEFLRQESKLLTGTFVAIPLIILFSRGLVEFPDAGYADRSKEATQIISDANYPILSEKSGIVLDAGKTPYLCDPFILEQMAKMGTWDEAPLLNDLNTNRIPYVITQYKLPDYQHYRFNKPVQESILANYHVIMDASDYDYSFVVYKANK